VIYEAVRTQFPNMKMMMPTTMKKVAFVEIDF
jgi:hypothetical protein